MVESLMLMKTLGSNVTDASALLANTSILEQSIQSLRQANVPRPEAPSAHSTGRPTALIRSTPVLPHVPGRESSVIAPEQCTTAV